MENYKIFFIKASMNTKYFLIDIAMDDELRSHRYYFLKHRPNEKSEILRVRNIESLLNSLRVEDLEIIDIEDSVDDSVKKGNAAYDNSSLDEKMNNDNLLSMIGEYDVKVLEKVFKVVSMDEQRRNSL